MPLQGPISGHVNDECARDRVVPRSPVRVDQNPEKSKSQHDGGENTCEASHDRVSNARRGPVDPHQPELANDPRGQVIPLHR